MDRGLGLVAAAMLALGVAVSGYLVGEGFREGRKAERYVTVKGLAEKTVKADQALWMLQLTRASDDLGLVQQSLERDVAAVRSFFTQSGLSADEIGLARLEVIDQLAQAYRSQPINDNRYIINQTVKVESDKVDIVNGLQNQTNELLKLGVIVNGWSPAVFTYNGLNAVKPEMIAEATQAARASAEQFAEDSGSDITGILRANQGVFSIQSAGSAFAEPESLMKKVRAVVTIDYRLED